MTAERDDGLSRVRSGLLNKALGHTIAVLIVLWIAPVPAEIRLLVLLLIALGWLLAGIHWAYHRFGKVGIVALAGTGLALTGVAGYAYWQDMPNRQLVAQIRDLHAFYVGTTGTLFTGEVDYVYFDSVATDEEVEQFTRLDGLAAVRRLVFKETKLADATTNKVGRFSEVRELYLESTNVSPATIEQLRALLPKCAIEVK